MEEPPKKGIGEEREKVGNFASIGEDLLRNILSRLPALSYASAACVSHSWNRLCNEILSRPKLLSALSLNPNLEVAINEVFDKVLSEPIRPHFAIACIGPKFSLEKTHQIVRAKLGSGIPVITSVARGIIGRDALTNEFREVKWEEDDCCMSENDYNSCDNVNRGIILIVGFVPGLKVNVIPLLQSEEDPLHVSTIDKFVMDIKDYTTSVSGSTSPAAILMFGDQNFEKKQVLEKMDYAMSGETVIVGDENGCFLYNSGDDSRNFRGSQKYSLRKNTGKQLSKSCKCDAVALVFAKDQNKSHGIGEIRFNLALSTGVSPVGPTYKGASVLTRGKLSERSTWLTAKREGFLEKLDGQRILHDIDTEQIENDIVCDDLYIAVTKRRKCSIGLEKGRLVTSLVFHEVLGGDEEYLYVKGDGIKTGDSFRFYHPNPEAALMSRSNVFENFRSLKQDWCCKATNLVGVADDGQRKVICGGFIFSCCGRGESFFGRRNVDSSAVLDNFPGLPLAGMFCCGEIGRGSSISIGPDVGQEQNSASCCLHVYSSLYLMMLYIEKPLVH